MPNYFPDEEVIQWSKDRNLLQTTTVEKQGFKLMEEFGEFCEGYLKNKPKKIKDSLGDMFVVLVQLAELSLGESLSDCAWSAYDEIKDRKGEMRNGSFIKEEDL